MMLLSDRRKEKPEMKLRFKIGLLVAAVYLAALPAFAASYSLTEQPWKLKPYVGEMDRAWLAYDYDDSAWLSQKLPAQWQMLPEFAEKYGGKMAYRYRFDFTKKEGKDYWLKFNGVFYKAEVWLNGERLGDHTGYFAPFKFKITKQLQDQNVLTVLVDCPYEDTENNKKQVTGVFGHWDVINSHFNPGGIWGDVQIFEEVWGRGTISDLSLNTLALAGDPKNPDRASLLLKCSVATRDPSLSGTLLKVRLEPQNFSGQSFEYSLELPVPTKRNFKAGLPANINFIEHEFLMQKPALWWTWDRGAPNLYRVTVSMEKNGEVMATNVFLTGIRTIEKRCQAGQSKEGLCWQFHLNGLPIYIRGNNYAPSDAFLSQAKPEVIRKDVEMMRASYYNMIRVHSHVDHPVFYDSCARAGILIWQDFPLQGGYDPSVFHTALQQARVMADLLDPYPSVAIWSCQNEPSGPNAKWNIKALDPSLKRVFEFEDPTRPVNLASGLPLKTDGHIYLGWYMLKTDYFGRFLYAPFFRQWMAFVTEFGAQAFPNYESAIKFMDPDINKIDWGHLEEYHSLQRGNMEKYIPLKPGMDLKTYIEATQDYQARIQKYYIDWLRSTKYEVNWGVISFLFNDSQPAITWSVVDYWREPKKAYFAIQESFQPVYAMARWRFDPYPAGRAIKLPIYVVNDLLQSFTGNLEIEIRDEDEVLLADSRFVQLGPDMAATRVSVVSFQPPGPGDYQLLLTLRLSGQDQPIVNSTVLKVLKKSSQ